MSSRFIIGKSGSLSVFHIPVMTIFLLWNHPGASIGAQSLQPDVFSTRPFMVSMNETEEASSMEEASGENDSKQTDSGLFHTRKQQIRYHRMAGLTTLGLWFATNLAGEQALRDLHPEMEETAQIFLFMDSERYYPLYLSMLEDNPSWLVLNSDSQEMINQYLLYDMVRSHSPWEAGSSGNVHRGLAAATILSYATAATLAWSSPPRYSDALLHESGGVDSVFLHKNMAFLHLAAFALMPVLAHRIEEEGPTAARTKQNVSWFGLTTLSLAAVTVSF